MLGAAVLVSHAGDLFAVRRQQRTCAKPGRAAELDLNGLAHVLHNMKPVGDLPRLRRTLLRALGERTAAIAADDLDTRMLLEPICCHAGSALRKKIDNLPLFQIHDDGPVSRALAPCPIVDAHDSRFPFGAARLHPSLEAAQNRIVAHRHADLLD